jgi:vesicle-associated membrane protein 7
VERSVTYLCLTDEKNKRRLPFSFLDDIKAKFQAAYAHERIAVAIAFSMNAEFSRVMEDRLNYFNDNPNADAFGKVKGQLDEVKGVMVDNIEKVRSAGGARARRAGRAPLAHSLSPPSPPNTHLSAAAGAGAGGED